MIGLRAKQRVADNSTFPDSSGIFHTHFSSDPALVGGVIAAAMERVAPMLATLDDEQGLEIALVEIVNNISEHAYDGDVLGPIELEIWQRNGELIFCILDRGVGFSNRELPAGGSANIDVVVADLPEGGFGWNLIRTLVQELKYERMDGRNCLTFMMPCRA